MTDPVASIAGAQAGRTEAEVLAARLLPAPAPGHPCLPGYAELVAMARAVLRLDDRDRDGNGGGGGIGR